MRASNFDKIRWIIQQEAGGTLRVASYLETGKSMFQLARKNDDDGFYRRLNSISSVDDAVVNDIKLMRYIMSLQISKYLTL